MSFRTAFAALTLSFVALAAQAQHHDRDHHDRGRHDRRHYDRRAPRRVVVQRRRDVIVVPRHR